MIRGSSKTLNPSRKTRRVSVRASIQKYAHNLSFPKIHCPTFQRFCATGGSLRLYSPESAVDQTRTAWCETTGVPRPRRVTRPRQGYQWPPNNRTAHLCGRWSNLLVPNIEVLDFRLISPETKISPRGHVPFSSARHGHGLAGRPGGLPERPTVGHCEWTCRLEWTEKRELRKKPCILEMRLSSEWSAGISLFGRGNMDCSISADPGRWKGERARDYRCGSLH